MSTTQVQPDLAPYLERCFLFDAVEDSYDISGITFKVDSINGDVAKLSIVSGELKVTDKDGKPLTALTAIPGSFNGITLKNENGWKVC